MRRQNRNHRIQSLRLLLVLSGRRLKWQLSEPQPEDWTPRPACYQHFNQGKRPHRTTTLWSKGGQNDTFGLLWRHSRVFHYNSCCMCLDVAALLPQVALDMVAGTMVGAANHRAMWHIATLQEEMRKVTGSPAFSGHFSRLRVLFCGGFRFSIQILLTLCFPRPCGFIFLWFRFPTTFAFFLCYFVLFAQDVKAKVASALLYFTLWKYRLKIFIGRMENGKWSRFWMQIWW